MLCGPIGVPFLKRQRILSPPRLIGVDSAAGTKSCVYFRFGAQHLYQARFATLRIFDLNLNLVGSIGDATHLNSAGDVEITANENFAFVSAEQGTTGACVSSYNISNKAAPVFVQQFKGPTPGTSLSGATCLRRDGNLLFVANLTRNSVAIISINPSTGGMTWVSEFRGTSPGTSLRSCRRIALDPVHQVCFWVCDNNAGGTMRLGAFSYANPASPVQLWAGAPAEADNARGVYYIPERGMLFVNAGGPSPFYGMLSAYEILDTTTTAFPRKLGTFVANGRSNAANRETMQGTRSTAFNQVGSRIYAAAVAETGFNLTLIDVTDPTHMFKVAQRWDTTLLNAPMDCQFGPDGKLYTGSFTSGAAQNITKWDLDLAA
jgi:hypothetical protein